MQPLRYLVCCLSALLIASCSSGSSAVPPATATAPGSPSAEALQGDYTNAFVTLVDLAYTWVPDPSSKGSSTSFCSAKSVDETVNPSLIAERSYKQKDSGPYLDQVVRSYESDGAQTALQYLKNSAQSCPTFTRTSSDGSSSITYSLTQIAAPQFEQDGVGLRLSASGVPSVGSVQIDYLFWTRGSLLVQLDHVTFGPSDGTFPSILLDLRKRIDARTGRGTP